MEDGIKHRSEREKGAWIIQFSQWLELGLMWASHVYFHKRGDTYRHRTGLEVDQPRQNRLVERERVAGLQWHLFSLTAAKRRSKHTKIRSLNGTCATGCPERIDVQYISAHWKWRTEMKWRRHRPYWPIHSHRYPSGKRSSWSKVSWSLTSNKVRLSKRRILKSLSCDS